MLRVSVSRLRFASLFHLSVSRLRFTSLFRRESSLARDASRSRLYILIGGKHEMDCFDAHPVLIRHQYTILVVGIQILELKITFVITHHCRQNIMPRWLWSLTKIVIVDK